MAQTPKQIPGTWITGANVNANDPAKGLKGVEQQEAQSVPDEPAHSDNKPEWYSFRKAQGYSTEQLSDLSKEALIALPDDPADYEPPAEDADSE